MLGDGGALRQLAPLTTDRDTLRNAAQLGIDAGPSSDSIFDRIGREYDPMMKGRARCTERPWEFVEQSPRSGPGRGAKGEEGWRAGATASRVHVGSAHGAYPCPLGHGGPDGPGVDLVGRHDHRKRTLRRLCRDSAGGRGRGYGQLDPHNLVIARPEGARTDGHSDRGRQQRQRQHLHHRPSTDLGARFAGHPGSGRR